ncbi:MAG: ABC transporter ATP-binding protein [Leucobacter sp.]
MTQRSSPGAELRIDGLTKHYGETVAVSDVILQVAAGEFITLLGPSGSGKSTTLAMIAGFTEPSSGLVHIDGYDVTSTPPHRRDLGVVFQNYSLFPHLTARQNVEYPLRRRRVEKRERQRRATQALELVELEMLADARPNQLSGGEQQRVALARALVFEPRLLLMDEPFGALDRALRERLQGELRRLHRDLGITVLFVTHDQEEALTLSDRIAVFNGGGIEQVGTPEELYEQPASLFVARFIGESNALQGEIREGNFVGDGSVRIATAEPEGPALAIVRPEHVMLTPASARESSCSVDGRIEDITYLGSQRRVEVSTHAGRLISRVGAEHPLPDVGASIRASWDPSRAVVFNAEPGTAPILEQR